MPDDDWIETLRWEFAALDCRRETKRLELLHARWVEEAPRSVTAASRLVELCSDDDANTQIGASWLLRARLEQLDATDVDIGPGFVAELAAHLPAIREPWARQHVCQCLGVLVIPAPHAPEFTTFLRAAADAEPKFLRAWGLDGFVRLSWQHPELAAEASERLRSAEEDEAASVRARARNLLREAARRPSAE